MISKNRLDTLMKIEALLEVNEYFLDAYPTKHTCKF